MTETTGDLLPQAAIPHSGCRRPSAGAPNAEVPAGIPFPPTQRLKTEADAGGQRLAHPRTAFPETRPVNTRQLSGQRRF